MSNEQVTHVDAELTRQSNKLKARGIFHNAALQMTKCGVDSDVVTEALQGASLAWLIQSVGIPAVVTELRRLADALEVDQANGEGQRWN
jgi:hypothetical protein